MTEAEWLVCADPAPMLDYLEAIDHITDTKQRLFDCTCVRRVWHLILDPRGRNAVEVAEKFAHGEAGLEELREAQGIALAAADARVTLYLPGTPNSYTALAAAAGVAWEFRSGADPLGYAAAAIAWEGLTENGRTESRLAKAKFAVERKNQADLLREIIGNPFRLVVGAHAWLAWNGGTVLKLAQAIYDEPAVDRLSILADALEEAGCTNEAVLSHCRDKIDHVRGCWVIDLLLGKR